MINLFIPFAKTNKASLNPESFCPLLQTTSMSIYDKKTARFIRCKFEHEQEVQYNN